MDKKRILIIDDEQDLIDCVKERLEANNYEVLSASEGLSGVKIAREELPDAIILDVMMPGIDGYHVCRILKSHEELKDIPVIFLTARTDEIDKRIAQEVKSDVFVSKPFESEDLLKAISDCLGD